MSLHKQHLELLLFEAFFWIDESLQQGLEAAGLPRLGKSQSMLLLAVEGGTCRPSRLAKRLGISRQAVHQHIAELEGLGLIELVPDQSDGRAKSVEFSASGAPIAAKARKILSDIESELEDRLGAENLGNLRHILELDWGTPLHTPENI